LRRYGTARAGRKRPAGAWRAVKVTDYRKSVAT